MDIQKEQERNWVVSRIRKLREFQSQQEGLSEDQDAELLRLMTRADECDWIYW